MAKYGEGDARWIVQDRKDGTNVGAWHWEEKDVLPWTKRRLQELLGDVTLVDGQNGISARTSGLKDVSGDAVMYNRKRRLIPAYELDVEVAWTGEVNGSRVEGILQLPYIAEENADEDPELQVSVSSEGTTSRQVKEAILAHGRQAVLAAVGTFVKEMRAGGPAASGDVSKLDEQETAPAENASAQPAPEALQASTSKAEEPKGQSGRAKGRRKLEMTEKFYARAQDIFECFTDAQRMRAFTQSPAVAEPKAGGRFEMFDGAVFGTFTEVERPGRIGINWAFRNWEPDVVSKVVLEIKEVRPGTTEVRLKHTGIPETDRHGNEDVLETTRTGWKQQIFQKIRAVFGFGVGL